MFIAGIDIEFLNITVGHCSGLREFFIHNSETIDLVNFAFRDSVDAANEATECKWTFKTDSNHILSISAPHLSDQLWPFFKVRQLYLLIDLMKVSV